MARKREILDFQHIYKPLTVDEALCHIPWLDKDQDHISFIQVIFVFPSNTIFTNRTASLKDRFKYDTLQFKFFKYP